MCFLPVGRFASNVLVAIPFVLMHSGVPYTTQDLLFLAVLLPLGLAWGALAQRSESLWGSVLFHAGTDVPVVLGLLSTMAGG